MEKGDELATGVAGGGFFVDAASGGIERRIQGERAMPVVREAVAFGRVPARAAGRIETIQLLFFATWRLCNNTLFLCKSLHSTCRVGLAQ